MTPTRANLPDSTEGMTDAQRTELAESYLDLMGCLLDAINECATGWAFVRWTGRGIEATGHLPDGLAYLGPRETTPQEHR